MSLILDQIPPQLKRAVDGYTWTADVLGLAETEVFQLTHERAAPLFLKVGTGPLLDEVIDEYERIVWLQGRLPVPAVRHMQIADGAAYLLLTAVGGVNLAEAPAETDRQKQTLVQTMATALRSIHGRTTVDCPFDHTLDRMLTQATARVYQGQVNEAEFDAEWWGESAPRLLVELIETQPESEDLVLCHGDYCLPNVLTRDKSLSGFVDLGRVGVADRYQDLALGWRSFNHNFGVGWGDRFLQQYGIDEPDQDRLRYYRLLDELF